MATEPPTKKNYPKGQWEISFTYEVHGRDSRCCSQILTALSLLNVYYLLIFKAVLFNINLMQATNARPYIFSFVPVATLRK